MSWNSPGSGDSRGSPDRPSAGPPRTHPRSSEPEEGRTQPQLQRIHQQISPRYEGEAIVRGGSSSPRQSRLAGYTSSLSSAAHRPLPQSYPAGPPLIQPYAQRTSPRFQPLHSPSNDGSQWSTSPSHASPQHSPEAWGRGFGPPTMPHSQAPFHQATARPQIPGTQTFLPSEALTVDTARGPSPHTATARSPGPTSPDDLRPLPQNLRGDPFRSAKVKTELCRHYNTPKGCVFGAKCNYAHGEHELKFNKLVDLEAAGMIDVEVFRCHACFTWVSTGACPFDQRCTRLHDPRVIGMQPSWLPHAEVLVNNTKKGREVDRLYHQQYSSIYSCSPVYGFAPSKRWRADETSTNAAWKEFYSFCCNADGNQPHSQGAQWHHPSHQSSPGPEITELHRVAMALAMRERRKAQQYVYLPSHVFCGELCLVLQTSFFVLEVVESFQDIRRYQVVEITPEQATISFEAGEGDRIIIAREIAFGPVADASVRPVSIWFNIKPENIAPCTSQQRRRHKRSRHRLRKKKSFNQPEEAKLSNSCPVPPFTSHQPLDEQAFNLITGIQTHRHRVLKYFSSGSDERALRSLALEEERLRRSFESQRRFWMTWTWPTKIGSGDVGPDTEVPHVDGTYSFVPYGDPGYWEDPLFFGTDEEGGKTGGSPQVISRNATLATGFVWKSFLLNVALASDQGGVVVPEEEELMPAHDPLIPTIRRIPMLRSLSLGRPAPVRGATRTIPHINSPSPSPLTPATSLDALIREWELMQRQFEEGSSHPLKDAHPDATRRRALPYDYAPAMQSWSRQHTTHFVPKEPRLRDVEFHH